MSITWNKEKVPIFEESNSKANTTRSRPASKITPTFQYKLADNPDLTVVGLLVTFPPNASTPPHRHGTANVIAYVIKGEILSGMNDSPTKVYKAGETWYEAPGCFHRVSDNASMNEEAILHATFVIKTEILEKEGPGILVQVEPKYLEGAMEQAERST